MDDASEATTLTAVLHRCQAGRARPMSAARPHGTQHDSPRCTLCSCSASIHPAPTRAVAKPCAAARRGVLVDVRLKPPRLLRCSTDVRPAGHGPRAPPGRMARSTTAHAAVCARALAASSPAPMRLREAVSSSLQRRARRRAAEATTLTAVLHRCQAGRAWPMSASRPHATQHDSPRCHLGSCSGSIHPPPTRPSRSR